MGRRSLRAWRRRFCSSLTSELVLARGPAHYCKPVVGMVTCPLVSSSYSIKTNGKQLRNKSYRLNLNLGPNGRGSSVYIVFQLFYSQTYLLLSILVGCDLSLHTFVF